MYNSMCKKAHANVSVRSVSNLCIITANVLNTVVGGSRGPNKTNRNNVRQITKFGIIMFCKILINI